MRYVRPTPLAFLLLLCALAPWRATPVHAAAASLVADLAPPTGPDWGSRPRGFFSYGGKIFFLAEESSAGFEMWVSDGTALGSEMLVDACPGRCSSEPEILGGANGYVFWHSEERLWSSDGTRAGTHILLEPELSLHSFAFNGRFFYFQVCTDRREPCGLWRSDGTPEGTARFLDASAFETAPGGLTTLNGKVYFIARSEPDDSELWVTDGTGGGTRVVRSFSRLSSPRYPTVAGGRLFFIAGETLAESSSQELWVSDGTAAGTRMVTRFQVPFPFAPTRWLHALGDQVYFLADDVTHGVELWKSDGTEAGTVRITQFGSENPFGDLETTDLALAGSRLVFRAFDGLTESDLWATSGTPESTVALADRCQRSFCSYLPRDLSSAGGRVLFAVDDEAHGVEPWSTDGTPAGTAMLRDVCPGRCGSIEDRSYPPVPLTFFGGGFFIATETEREELHPERERMNLWRSDGTAAGTRRWSDFSAPSAVLRVDSPAAVALDNEMLFAALVQDDGYELWASNGRAGGTRLVANLARGRAGSAPYELTAWGDRLAFTACTNSQLRVWQSAGTAATPRPLPGDSPSVCYRTTGGDGPAVTGLTNAGGALFYWQIQAWHDQTLWRSDGTEAGTRQLLSLQLDDRASAAPFQLEPLGNRVFFQVTRGYEPERTYELWRSDGTAAGTILLVSLSSQINRLTALGDAVYFSTGEGIWRSDGTVAGTRLAVTPATQMHQGHVLARAGSWLYFAGIDPEEGDASLWRTDGTAAGTVRVADGMYLAPLLASAVDHHGSLFVLVHGRNGAELWRSDGTAAGTVRVAQWPGVSLPESRQIPMASWGDAVYFALDDGVHGTELWKSDGTAAGTTLVRDLSPGPDGSNPTELTATPAGLYFTAHDLAFGFELWKTDGTAAGTRLVQDIAPGAASSSPGPLRVFGDRLFFVADDGLTGRELWSLPLAGPGCVPLPSRLCLGGRFAVEAAWKAQGRSGTGTAVGLTADTGYFWFFGPDNVEVIIKALDGRGVNGHHWVFYGALSDVEYTLTITDTETGAAARYSSLAGRLASVADTQAFGPLGAFAIKSIDRVAPPSSPALVAERFDPAAATGTCEAGPARLCLNGGRFAVEASWKAQGQSGTGKAVGLTADTGYFWFFGPENVEVVLKVLDGTPLNGKFWVFYGALSDVEYTLTVTDTHTGKVKTYANPAGRLASVADTGAF